MYLRQRRCVRHFAFVLLCVLPAPAALAQSVDIPLQLVQSTLGAQLLINIGIDGGASRPYLFDTGSSVFNAFYSPQAFGNVPSQQAGLPTEVLYQYTSGETYYGNLVETPSLTFYANSTSGTGVATLNATTPSGAQSSFLINALYGRLPTSQTTDANGNFLPNPPPPDAIPVPIGELNGSASGNSPGFYGIFGAGDFTSVVKGFSSNTTAVVGGVLGQASIPGTIAGYVVAANGTPLNSLMSNAGLNPGATINGPQVGQNVTSCSPCVMLGLTPALLAQFKSINTLHWTGTTDPFPLSGASASTHFGIDFNYTLTNASGETRHARGVPTLLDTGTVHYIFDKFGTNQNPPNGETITFSGAKNGSTQTTNVINPDGSSNFRYDSPYRAVFNGAVNGSTLGIGFFLQNSVLYNLQGEVVGYTPNFVTDTNIVTTSSSPLTIGSNSVPLGLAGVISGAGGVTITNGGSATLSGTSTYTGMTTITGGMLALAGPGSIGASRGVSVSSGGLFDISQVSGGTIIQSLSGDANGMVNLGQTDARAFQRQRRLCRRDHRRRWPNPDWRNAGSDGDRRL
jgi:autotransporter-associated beta strand protein